MPFHSLIKARQLDPDVSGLIQTYVSGDYATKSYVLNASGDLQDQINAIDSGLEREFSYYPETGYNLYWVPYSGGNILSNPLSIQLTLNCTGASFYDLKAISGSTSGFYTMFSENVTESLSIYCQIN